MNESKTLLLALAALGVPLGTPGMSEGQSVVNLYNAMLLIPLPCVQMVSCASHTSGGMRLCGKPARYIGEHWIFCEEHAEKRPGARLMTNDEYVLMVVQSLSPEQQSELEQMLRETPKA